MTENVHTLRPTTQSIFDELKAYHFERLIEFDARQRKKERSGKIAETKGVPSLARAFQAMAAGRLREDAPLEHVYFERVDGDAQRIIVPFNHFRDLTKGVASAGGYLVATETQDALDILRPWSVTARAGITIESGLVGDQAIPKTTAKSTPAWIPTEGTQATPSQQTLGQMVATPKSVSAVINFSRQLAKQANAEAFVRRELLNTIGTAVDQAVLSGTGASGQPTGLLNTAGIGTVTGASLAYSGIVNMKRKVADANAMDEEIAFLGTPGIRELLELRERSTNGAGLIWDDDRVASRPAHVSTDVPAATLICGAWPALYLGIWSSGFVVEINPFDSTHFKTGVIQARIILSCDVIVRHAAAFCKAESIT